MTIPNIITIFRLIIVPLVIVMIVQGQWGLAFILFLLAGVSDGLDGFIARKFDMRSEFGAFIDPLADKALLVSIYVTLAIEGVIPGWLVILVVSRDVIILSAIMVSLMMARPMAIKPLFVSKLNTAVQIGFAALILALKAFDVDPGRLVDALMVLVAALTVASLVPYLGKWLRHMAG